MLTAALPATTAIAQVSRRFLDRLEVTEEAESWRVRIVFDRPVRYLRHAPASKGRRLVVELTPLQLGAGAPPLPRLREALAPPPNARGGPLLEVVYEGDRTRDVMLELRFASDVRFEVLPGDDGRSLEVEISAATSNGSTSARRRTLLEQARRALTANELDRATLLLQKASAGADGDERTAREAKELLAIVHERRGQTAHARAEYEEYLARWPDGRDSDRVRQRLDALLTARTAGREALRKDERDEAKALEADLFGSLSTAYTRVEGLSGDTAGETYDSSLFTDVFLVGRARGASYELRSELAASYRFDFLESSSGDDTRISRLFADLATIDRSLAATFGRQSRSSGGVLGRFDGLRVEGEIVDDVVLSAVGGFLVDGPSTVSVSTDRPVYAAAIDFRRILDHLDAQIFYTGQYNHGSLDRMAVGGEARWIQPGLFAIAFVDYDVEFQSLNTALLSGTVRFLERWTLHLLGETRNSPFLTLENALIGQPGADELDELNLDDDALADLAKDRTARSWTGSLGLTHRTTDRLQLAADVTVSGTSDTKASGGVAATEEIGPETSVGVQGSLSNFLIKGGYSNLGIRYRDGEYTNTTSWSLSARLPVVGRLAGTLRLRGSYLEGSGPIEEQLALHPSLRLDWRRRSLWRRLDLVVDAEVGLDWIDGLGSTNGRDELGYFLELVLRLDF